MFEIIYQCTSNFAAFDFSFDELVKSESAVFGFGLGHYHV